VVIDGSASVVSISPAQIASVSGCMKCMKAKIFDHANLNIMKYVSRLILNGIDDLLGQRFEDVWGPQTR